jgi:hypothetical protein
VVLPTSVLSLKLVEQILVSPRLRYKGVLMMLGRPNPQLQLSPEERETLERWVRRPSSRLTTQLNAGGLVGGAVSVACTITVAGQRGAPNWRSTDRSAADRIAGPVRSGTVQTEQIT